MVVEYLLDGDEVLFGVDGDGGGGFEEGGEDGDVVFKGAPLFEFFGGFEEGGG